MASRQNLDFLVSRIRWGVSSSCVMALAENDLDSLWEKNQDLSSIEKALLIKNFAITYGFEVNVIADVMSATFRS